MCFRLLNGGMFGNKKMEISARRHGRPKERLAEDCGKFGNELILNSISCIQRPSGICAMIYGYIGLDVERVERLVRVVGNGNNNNLKLEWRQPFPMCC